MHGPGNADVLTACTRKTVIKAAGTAKRQDRGKTDPGAGYDGF